VDAFGGGLGELELDDGEDLFCGRENGDDDEPFRDETTRKRDTDVPTTGSNTSLLNRCPGMTNSPYSSPHDGS
jgi:hypothetical protein